MLEEQKQIQKIVNVKGRKDRAVVLFGYGLGIAILIIFISPNINRINAGHQFEDMIHYTFKDMSIQEQEQFIEREKSAELAKNKRREKMISYVIIGFTIIFWIVVAWRFYTDPSNRKRREKERIAREENERIAQVKAEHTLQLAKEMRMAENQRLMDEIRNAPRYARWKRDVIKENGRMCEACRSIENLEVHHRESLYSLMRAFQIKNVVEALETDALWYVSNGLVLCKSCHDQTKSSQYRNKIMGGR